MANIQYIGRAGKFLGKSLPQICLRLKDHGVGRMLVREVYKRYPEVTYYVLTKMEADMSDEYLRRGNFEARVVFRGGHYGVMNVPGWKEDWQLVPRDEEAAYLARTLPEGQKWRAPTSVPRFVDLPPLLKLMLIQEAREAGVEFKEDELRLPFITKSGSAFSHATYK